MTSINYPTYDFATSAKIEHQLWVGFDQWMEKFANLLCEQWASFSSTEIKATPKSISAHEFSELQEGWESHCAVEIAINDESTTGFLLVKRDPLLGSVMRILGDAGDVENRSMTVVELALARLLFQRFSSAIVEAWPSQSQLTCNIGEILQQPNRSKKFPADMLLICSGLAIEIDGLPVDLSVLLNKEQTRMLFDVPPRAVDSVPGNSQISQELVADINVRVSAELGSAVLGVDEVAGIKAGDIIVLEQPVSDPLIVCANESPVFRAWPGRVANTQALKIESLSIK